VQLCRLRTVRVMMMMMIMCICMFMVVRVAEKREVRRMHSPISRKAKWVLCLLSLVIAAHLTHTLQHSISMEVNRHYVHCYHCDEYVANDTPKGDLALFRELLQQTSSQVHPQVFHEWLG
jgi:hypothetical protein